MSEKRFKSVLDEETMSVMPYLVSDKKKEAFYKLEGCVDLLNRLSEENNRLKVENELLKMENEEQTRLCRIIGEDKTRIARLEEQRERLEEVIDKQNDLIETLWELYTDEQKPKHH